MFNILHVNAYALLLKQHFGLLRKKNNLCNQWGISDNLQQRCLFGNMNLWQEGKSTTTFKWHHRLTHQGNDKINSLAQMKQEKCFSLYINMCPANSAIWQYGCNLAMVVIRRKEKCFSCSLPKDTTSFQRIKPKRITTVNRCGLEFKFYGQVYSDSTAAMIGKHSGVTTQINKIYTRR